MYRYHEHQQHPAADGRGGQATPATASAPFRVFIAHRHTLFRQGLAQLLQARPDVEVVGQCADGASAVRLAAAVRPSAVLLDGDLPAAVPEAVAELRRVCPEAQVLLAITSGTLDDHAQRCLAAGARALLAMDITGDALVDALRAVVERGQTVIWLAEPAEAASLGEPVANPLSVRELDVLRCAGQALSNAQIAAQLFITEGTVKRHLTNVYLKLDAVSRLDAVFKAARAGFIRLPGRSAEPLRMVRAPVPRDLPRSAGPPRGSGTRARHNAPVVPLPRHRGDDDALAG